MDPCGPECTRWSVVHIYPGCERIFISTNRMSLPDINLLEKGYRKGNMVLFDSLFTQQWYAAILDKDQRVYPRFESKMAAA